MMSIPSLRSEIRLHDDGSGCRYLIEYKRAYIMVIPKIIHQTWKNEDPPKGLVSLADSWKNFHSDWGYRLWTDEMNRDFISKIVPDFLPIYDSFPKPIQRVDAVRYFILYEFGGVFVDLDFECKKNFLPLLGEADAVFGIEPAEHAIIHGMNSIVSNAFMAVKPRHELMGAVCKQLLERTNEKNVYLDVNEAVLHTTGPFMLSRVLSEYQGNDTVSLLESDLLYPLTKDQAWSYFDNPAVRADYAEQINKSYAIHFFSGTWWKPNARVEYQ